MNENKELFETMPVPKALATLAIPTIISQLITMKFIWRRRRKLDFPPAGNAEG